MDLMSLILQLIGGIGGGNAAGAAMKGRSLGNAGNSIIGAMGGLVLGQVVERLTGGAISADTVAQAAQGMDLGGIITNLLSSGVGGAVLTAIIGMMKSR
jgi:hypothetical protein